MGNNYSVNRADSILRMTVLISHRMARRGKIEPIRISVYNKFYETQAVPIGRFRTLAIRKVKKGGKAGLATCEADMERVDD